MFKYDIVEFVDLLKKNKIDTSIVHFENSVADGYYVLKTTTDGKSFSAKEEKITIILVSPVKVTL